MQKSTNENKFKLNFELVPDGCWYFNLRSLLSTRQWNAIKKFTREKYNGKCAICGRETKLLHSHERWSYDLKNGVQKLDDIIAVCKDCHSVIHIGRTQLKGDIVRAENHYMKVNNCTYAEYRYNLGVANKEHQERNKVSEWKLDLTNLEKILK